MSFQAWYPRFCSTFRLETIQSGPPRHEKHYPRPFGAAICRPSCLRPVAFLATGQVCGLCRVQLPERRKRQR